MITLTAAPLVVYGLPIVLVLAALIAAVITVVFHMVREKIELTDEFGRTEAQRTEWGAGQEMPFPGRK